MTKEEFLKSKLAGLNTPHETTKYSLGDYVAIATGNYYFCEQIKENDMVFKAHHAGITKEETETDDETRYPLQSPIYPWNPNGTFYDTGKPVEITCDSNNPYTVKCSSDCKQTENN
jgi:hypothetical protein